LVSVADLAQCRSELGSDELWTELEKLL
jgi:hypothetical protein